MKRLLGLLMFVLSLTMIGCTNENFKVITFEDTDSFKSLSKVNYPNKEFEYYDYNNGLEVSPIQNFTLKMVKEMFKDKNNYIFSPISLYMALSMLIEGATDETFEEIKSLLDIKNLEENQKQMKLIYEHNYYKNEFGCLRMANSIWNNGREINEDYLNVLSTKYYAECYKTIFDEVGKNNIIKWINNYTNDFLHLTKDNYQISDTIALLLLNTIYFDNKWANEFKESDSYQGEFFIEKQIIQTDYMKHTVVSTYSESELSETIIDKFKNDNYIKFILPKNNVSVFDCLTYDELFGKENNKIATVNVNLSIPKFKYQNSYNLNDVLRTLGVQRMFSDVGEFGKINSELFVSFVRQDVGIQLNEKGVKAAAVSSIGMKDSAIAIDKNITMILDKPFIYIIYDSKNVPLFIGIVQNPNL